MLAFQSPNSLLMRFRNFEKQPCRFFYIPDLSLHKLYRLGERFMPFGEPVHSCIKFRVGHSQPLVKPDYINSSMKPRATSGGMR